MPQEQAVMGQKTTTIERVCKYALPFGDWATVHMPEGAQVINVQVQNGDLYLWARVTVGNPPIAQQFRIAGTGHDLGSSVGRHIGTLNVSNGDLIIHVFAEAILGDRT